MTPQRKILLALGLLAAVNLAEATPIVLEGDHFSVRYDDAQVGVYREGRLSGSLDSLYFLPTNFAVAAADVLASTQAGLQFTLSIDPGYAFDGLVFAQNGNYFLSDAGRVRASASLQARDPDTLAATTLVLGPPDTLTQAGVTTNWALAGLLGANGLDSARVLQVSLDNTLTSEPILGLGFIQSTYVGLHVRTRAHAVPEPSGLALMLVGGLTAAFVGRRARATRGKTWADTGNAHK